jgi:N-acyl amino acid synthase of PEP-CTERM/exosortase system
MGFVVHKVSDDDKLRTVYRLRYKVYCEEWGFERPEDYPDGLETDIFDKRSVSTIFAILSAKMVKKEPIGPPPITAIFEPSFKTYLSISCIGSLY